MLPPMRSAAGGVAAHLSGSGEVGARGPFPQVQLQVAINQSGLELADGAIRAAGRAERAELRAGGDAARHAVEDAAVRDDHDSALLVPAGVIAEDVRDAGLDTADEGEEILAAGKGGVVAA